MVDLHIHSNKSSDGALSPAEIVHLARKKGMSAIAIADHDTTAAYPEAILQGEKEGVEVIPSVELTTRFEKREFHLLLPLIDWERPHVQELTAEVARRRIVEAKARVRKLQEIGMAVTWEDVQKEAGNHPPVGMTIALALLKRAKISGDSVYQRYYDGKRDEFAPFRFYKDYLMPGKKAAVPRRTMDLTEVLLSSKKTGGVPVLAHPGAAFMQADITDLKRLKALGLEGLEVYTTYHDNAQTAAYKNMADELDLVATAGSDFHGPLKPGVSFGCI
ncbi:MAG: PHP domain-containing protein, partial [Candidatus Aminicenantes bacterium]|nr:PHP domain-containing protein [Candidatus Aminicenantes bacterium]